MNEMQVPIEAKSQDLDARIASRVKALRTAQGLTIDTLAERSGVSRAMISKVERTEASPTAVLLSRIASALGITLSQLFSDTTEQGPLVRAADRPVWRDPATGYLRRVVTPDSYPADLVDVTLSPLASVTYDNALPTSIDQAVWVLEGVLAMAVGEDAYMLHKGDCLQMRLDRPLTFHNPSQTPTRYAVILARGLR